MLSTLQHAWVLSLAERGGAAWGAAQRAHGGRPSGSRSPARWRRWRPSGASCRACWRPTPRTDAPSSVQRLPLCRHVNAPIWGIEVCL